MKIRRIIIVVIILLVSAEVSAETIVYQTWTPWETDSVLTAWAIKRYVHPEATFVSLPRGTKILPENSIDVPNSPYRRSAKRTALDKVIRIHGIDSECIKKILPIVRLLELAPWRKSENREAEDFEYGLRPLLPGEPVKGGLDDAFGYIDQFCKLNTDKKEK